MACFVQFSSQRLSTEIERPLSFEMLHGSLERRIAREIVSLFKVTARSYDLAGVGQGDIYNHRPNHKCNMPFHHWFHLLNSNRAPLKLNSTIYGSLFYYTADIRTYLRNYRIGKCLPLFSFRICVPVQRA